jgi:hypothetical protein
MFEYRLDGLPVSKPNRDNAIVCSGNGLKIIATSSECMIMSLLVPVYTRRFGNRTTEQILLLQSY